MELRGYTLHHQAKPKGWVVEVRGYTTHSQAKRKAPLIVEFLWPQPKAALKVDPVEASTTMTCAPGIGAVEEAVVWSGGSRRRSLHPPYQIWSAPRRQHASATRTRDQFPHGFATDAAGIVDDKHLRLAVLVRSHNPIDSGR